MQQARVQNCQIATTTLDLESLRLGKVETVDADALHR